MVATGDPGLTADKIEIAEHNAGHGTRVREHTLARSRRRTRPATPRKIAARWNGSRPAKTWTLANLSIYRQPEATGLS